MSGAGNGLGPCLLVVLSLVCRGFGEGCGLLDWFPHLHPLPVPLFSFLQGKKNPRVLALKVV